MMTLAPKNKLTILMQSLYDVSVVWETFYKHNIKKDTRIHAHTQTARPGTSCGLNKYLFSVGID